jgi:ADP-dependent NAD(P)H-hydrate dehydratase / NAD(P)H-hydrate epimerase
MTRILSTNQIRMADEYTIQHEPISSLDLMERASKKLLEWILRFIPVDRLVYVFAGPGNNGGDGLALARLLFEKNYRVEVYLLKMNDSISKDAEVNLLRLANMKKAKISRIQNKENFPFIHENALIIDALFGSGLKKPLDGIAKELVMHLNKSGIEILSVDIPSGLFGEDNRGNPTEGIIRAKNTLTFQFPKLAFLFSENNFFTGNWHVLDIGLHPEFIKRVDTKWHYTLKGDVKGLIKERRKFDHKGSYGHALLLSGSKGKTGAAVLSAKACLKAGCGLVTVHIPGSSYDIFQSALPEAMCSIDPDENIITSLPDLKAFNAVGIGPGIGTKKPTAGLLKSLLQEVKIPMVIDADGLNILSENRDLLKFLPENTVLTPHPGEFDRLAGKSEGGYERFLKLAEFSKQQKAIVVLKGAYTSIASPDGMISFNSTGNQGMATAGTGDVLTGMILSFLAQGYSPLQAAVAGVYIHGRAGDLALNVQSYESLIAGDIIECIGSAFKELVN